MSVWRIASTKHTVLKISSTWRMSCRCCFTTSRANCANFLVYGTLASVQARDKLQKKQEKTLVVRQQTVRGKTLADQLHRSVEIYLQNITLERQLCEKKAFRCRCSVDEKRHIFETFRKKIFAEKNLILRRWMFGNEKDAEYFCFSFEHAK